MPNIGLAGPNHLERVRHLFGESGGNTNIFVFEPAPETAADHVAVQGDLVERQPGHACRFGLGAARNLCAAPDLRAVRPDMSGAVDRLHRRMGEEGRVVDCLQLDGSPRDRGIRIAFLARDEAGRDGGIFMTFHDLRLGQVRIGAQVLN